MDLEDRNRLPLMSVNLTVTGTNWTTKRATGQFWQDINGLYWCDLQIRGSVSAVVLFVDLAVEGLKFKNDDHQSLATIAANNIGTRARCTAGTNIVRPQTSTNELEWAMNGGPIELDEKPLFLE